MESLVYLLQVSACLGLFYGFYHLFLRKLTFFTVNRFYLLGTLILSLVIPALEFQIQGSGYRPAQPVESIVYANTFDEGQVAVSSSKLVIVSEAGATAWDWEKMIALAYWLIAGGILLSFLFRLFRLLWHTRHIDQRTGGLKIIYKAEGFTNCSFLNYVFVDQQHMTEEEVAQIIRHESVHVRCAHSADKIIVNLFKALLWFNPIVYLYDYAMEQVHEYEADKRTSSVIGNASYASLLLSIATKKNNPALVHSIVKHPLKERIQMLFAGESKHIKKLIYIAVLPIGVALTGVFGIQVVYANIPLPAYSKVIDLVQKEDAPEPAQPLRELKVKKVVAEQRPTDSLLMIDYPRPSEITEVIIDGTSYPTDMLYKISPRCVSTQTSRDNKIILTTHDKEILYATETDRYNKRIRNKANAKEVFYSRYTLRREDGGKSDEIRIKMNGRGGGGSVGLKKGAEVLLIIDGRRYHESILKTITNEEYATGWRITFSTGTYANTESTAKYGKKYDAKIELSRSVPPDQEAVSMPISFSAKDSTKVSDNKNIVQLYGAATIKYQYSTITADYIAYNSKEMTGVAKGATYSDSRSGAPGIVADSIIFNLQDSRFTSYGVKKQ